MEHIHGGVWQLFVADASENANYKYAITTKNGDVIFKADPVAFGAAFRPETTSKVVDLTYQWQDKYWLGKRKKKNHFKEAMNIYEVHLGSWMQHPRQTEEPNFYNYREIAEKLVPYAKEMGYTHLEFLPVMEHPFDGSWGYQATGYFAPTARYGSPTDFKFLVDTCHKAGIGVILDWAGGHFCADSHGLGQFNGDKLYEIEKHNHWGTYKFDFGRPEVRSFLISNLLFWLKEYHVDGIRVDGVSSMVYLNYDLHEGEEKRFNKNGGEENLEAVAFLRQMNTAIGEELPDVFTIAEESSAFPLVTYPPHEGGLGFHYKWDMGWMNDTLEYMALDFEGRKYNHQLLTFSMMYAFNENFILPISHDEVVHGKLSLVDKMSGSYWRKFANLRLLYLYQLTHSGAKLNFMGNEIAQFIEWREYEELEWFMLEYEAHQKHQDFVKAANKMYLKEKALWQENYSWDGFVWIDADNAQDGVAVYKRLAGDNEILVILNFQPQTYENFEIHVEANSSYKEIFNSDNQDFGGAGKINTGTFKAKDSKIKIRIPALAGIMLKKQKLKK